MAPTDQRAGPGRIQLDGTLRVSCADFHFRLCFQPGRMIVDFPSFSMLLRARNEAEDLKTAVANLPPLPGSPGGSGRSALPIDLSTTRLWVAVNRRPVGEVVTSGDGMRFKPTPFSFFTRLSD